MELPRIFKYENETLEDKFSFTEFEKGSFGIFYEDWGHHNICPYDKNNLIIFAPNQKDFNNSQYKFGDFENDYFLSFLGAKVDSVRIDKEKLNWGKRFYRGGKDGEYKFEKGILLINPFWKSNAVGGDSKSVGEILKSVNLIKDYKILEGLHEVVI